MKIHVIKLKADCPLATHTKGGDFYCLRGLSGSIQGVALPEAASVAAYATANGFATVATSADQIERAIGLGEQFVVNNGISAFRLATLQDNLLQAKEAGTLASKPKLVALYTWLQTVKATALAGSTDFPKPPYTFNEVITE